ncbi:hypothetical protein B0P06_006042 [Clostridium saccharoperbutylacetonicum]|uniref:Atrophied bacterial Ig domain-containing protein n=3 Tax=Clostridium TaxID=1485 RepID=M1MYH3_9CLOT|nr:immunoglobulin-like domain-containing protein [Clostridium saccharoperbutylacetonicum]AGF59576.1 hypothetical protein Cspa_135p00160 [Clostridium saccharoperbutylacetonicum N1-4(HMT)]NRT64567.1 hypothetical protein [Clostridium saccharoperbutylacetonicum]NSB28935.1 hypothetical protein [Clostridium saccharoperbutylacetonicum]NSB46149.1 hypothetical protein [Clostridium saccharoperbutylacetonicum]
MDNSLLSMNLEKNFVYHEVLTDSDNAVKDIARLLALGTESEEIIDASGTLVKPATPIIDKCWEVVYPKEDRTKHPEIEDWNNLLPEEYKKVTEDKISKITDTVILKTKTIPKDIKVNNSSEIGVNQDLNKNSIEMYLEIYMPPYLCDSESEDPIKQRTGYVPQVNDVNGIASGNTRVARNYHHLFMRIFDNINEAGTAPAENVIDSVTRDVIKWNSRSSSWSKLSWYTDFEDKFKAPLLGHSENGMQSGTVRLPVLGGLTSESKIKLWINVNASRFALGVMGSPNVDFSDNRYLIGCAYVGQIDSFDFSINDTAGNFGLFCTSSTSPAMGKTEVKTRASVPAIISGSTVTPGSGATGSGTRSNFQTGLRIFNPGTVYDLTAMEIANVPYDYNNVDGGVYWGTRYIDTSTVKLYCTFDAAPSIITYTNAAGSAVRRSIGCPGTVAITPSSIEVDPNNRHRVKINLTLEDLLKAFIGDAETKLAMAGKGISFLYVYYNGYANSVYNEAVATLNIQYNFSYYTEYTVQTGGVKRDKFGNPVAAILDTTYGKNTANGITDFAMYATFTKDYFQRHFLMFASTEEYMQKELYGKSSYTGEYFADRIKIVHSSEGPRGILSGMITIDTSSLYPFDELIVNKDFEKYQDKPEELYVYLPITAPYCPFANSPNGRHGIGILKDIRYPIPVTDEEIVRFAVNEIARKYSDLGYITEDIKLISSSKYGAKITWKSTDATLIEIPESKDPAYINIAKVHRPDFDPKKDNPKVTLTAVVTHGSVTKEYDLALIVKMLGVSDSQSIIWDLNDLVLPKEATDNIILPTKGKNGCDIKWDTDNAAVIAIDGTVTRPDVGKGDVIVTLTATVTKGKESPQPKKFQVTVKNWTEDEELQQAYDLVSWDLIKGKNTNSQAITYDLELSTQVGTRGVTAEWILVSSSADNGSKNGKIDITTGIITRPTYTQGQVTFQISCKLTKSGKTETKLLPPFIMAPLDITDAEIAQYAKNILELTPYLGDNVSPTKITTAMNLPIKSTDSNASRAIITWSLVDVDHKDLQSSIYITLTNTADNCAVQISRPSNKDGNKSIGLKAVISVISSDGKTYVDPNPKYFDIIILAS